MRISLKVATAPPNDAREGSSIPASAVSLPMKVIFAVAFLAGSFYLIWWGYKHLIMREREDRESGDMDGGLCHLCRRAFIVYGGCVVR